MEDKFGNIVLKNNVNMTSSVPDVHESMLTMYRAFSDEYDVGDIYYPKGGLTEPTSDDYSAGYMWRYFYRQHNRLNMKVAEIKKSDYDNASSHYLYKTIAIKWKLVGSKENTAKINKNIISMAEPQLIGISNTLWNPLEFWMDGADPVQQDVNVTSKYVAKNSYVASNTLKIVEPTLLTTTETDNYILTQDYVVILTQDSVGLYY